jgi:hypothetical protein
MPASTCVPGDNLPAVSTFGDLWSRRQMPRPAETESAVTTGMIHCGSDYEAAASPGFLAVQAEERVGLGGQSF